MAEERASPMNSLAGLGIRVLLHAAFWSLLAVWTIGPRSPSKAYRTLLLGGAALMILAALLPRLRRTLAAFLRRRLHILDILAVNIVLLIGLSEAAVRMLARVYDSPLLAPTDASAAGRIRHHRGRPHGLHNHQRLNALGLFDTEFEIERKPGTRRIVALADSFGAGVVPLEENFLTLLEKELDEEEPTEVLNFGIPGMAPPEYLHLYRTEARQYDPDLVLLCFFIGNDFVLRKKNSILHPESLLSLAVIKRLRAMEGEADNISAADPGAPTFSEEAFLRVEKDRLGICRVPSDREAGKRYEDTLEVLAEIHGELGDRLRVALIPDEFQVNDALYARLVKGRGEAFDRTMPNRRLAAFFEEQGVAFLDLLEALREAERSGPAYKPRDTHWNRRGNAAAAAAIARWLRADS